MDLDINIHIKGCDLEVQCLITNVKTGYYGIGAYEFWGARGFDKGHLCVDDFSAENIKVFSYRRKAYVSPSPRLLKTIEEFIYGDDDVYEKILENEVETNEALEDEIAERRWEEKYG